MAPDAFVIGEVTIGAASSVWFNAVVRGDRSATTIGDQANLQDGCAVHSSETRAVAIGDRVTLGHGAMVHAATIGDDVMVGMNAVILDFVSLSELYRAIEGPRDNEESPG